MTDKIYFAANRAAQFLPPATSFGAAADGSLPLRREWSRGDAALAPRRSLAANASP